MGLDFMFIKSWLSSIVAYFTGRRFRLLHYLQTDLKSSNKECWHLTGSWIKNRLWKKFQTNASDCIYQWNSKGWLKLRNKRWPRLLMHLLKRIQQKANRKFVPATGCSGVALLPELSFQQGFDRKRPLWFQNAINFKDINRETVHFGGHLA